ncbi:MAG TPA: hypothetical protein VF163_03920 [Micromonosporaceae bacterium]
MKKSRTFMAVATAVTVAVAAGAALLAHAALRCRPPTEQAEMIELYRSDPLMAAAPSDGWLADEWYRSGACDLKHDRGDREASTGPAFAEVGKVYETPDVYTVDELLRLFAQPAATAGWHVEGPPEVGGSLSRVLYCKQTGARVSYAVVYSSAALSTRNGKRLTAVLVSIDAGGEGTRCGADSRGR